MRVRRALEMIERIDDLLNLYLEYIRERRGYSKDTVNTYRSNLRCFVEFLNSQNLDLSIKSIDIYADSLLLAKLSQRTFRNKLIIIRGFVKFLYIKDFCDIKSELIELPKYKSRLKEDNFLDQEEELALINACIKPRDKALILFLIRSGLRVSEFIDLKIGDVYNRSVFVRDGKGGKQRITFIDTEADTALKKYLLTRKDDSDYMFPSTSGGRLSRQYVARLVSEIAERAGIKKRVSPHTLRHTFASRLLWAGARAEDIQPMMGHSTIRTTRIYMHYTNKYLQERYDTISSAIKEQNNSLLTVKP